MGGSLIVDETDVDSRGRREMRDVGCVTLGHEQPRLQILSVWELLLVLAVEVLASQSPSAVSSSVVAVLFPEEIDSVCQMNEEEVVTEGCD